MLILHLFLIKVLEDFVSIIGLQFDIAYSSSTSTGCIRISSLGSSNQINVSKCIFKGSLTGGHLSLSGIRIQDGFVKAKVKITNCIFYDFYNKNYPSSAFGGSAGVTTVYAAEVSIINCVSYRCSYGYYVANYGSVREIINSVGICDAINGNYIDISVANPTKADYNCSSDASAVGSNSLMNKALDDVGFVSTTTGSEDFHIQSTSDLVGAGIGPDTDSDVPTTDIDGDTRSGTNTDIGPDLYTSGSTILPINGSLSSATGMTAGFNGRAGAGGGLNAASLNPFLHQAGRSGLSGDLASEVSVTAQLLGNLDIHEMPNVGDGSFSAVTTRFNTALFAGTGVSGDLATNSSSPRLELLQISRSEPVSRIGMAVHNGSVAFPAAVQSGSVVFPEPAFGTIKISTNINKGVTDDTWN